MSDRKPVADAFRIFMGGSLTQAETDALDTFLDKFRPRVVVPADNPFEAALTEVLKHEGGYADHPRDPGGRTMLGSLSALGRTGPASLPAKAKCAP